MSSKKLVQSLLKISGRTLENNFKIHSRSIQTTSVMEKDTKVASAILEKVNDIVQKHKLLSDHYDTEKKVVDFEHPKDLQKLLPLDIEREGISDDALVKIRFGFISK